MTRRIRSAPAAAALLLLAALPACTTRPYDANLVPKAGRELSATQISQLSGTNAWDVIRTSGLPLTVLPSESPGEARVVRRGVGSMLFNEEPVVILDGVRLNGMEALTGVPKSQIHTIRLLTGLDATQRYGSGARGGAIVIETHRPR